MMNNIKLRHISRNITITIGPLLIGAMNTFFIKKKDIGSWKNYVGYALLLLGAINALMIIAEYLSPRLKIKTRNTLFKIIALIIPFYFVYYWPLHEKQNKNEIKILWKYIFIGFVIYTSLISYYVITNHY